MTNPLVIFDLTGAQAMFRKFYTNSSSLSYPFPPRSTLAGTVAGLMGYERDTYAEDLGMDRCDIAVSVRVPVRRVMQRVNYLKTKGPGGFDGSEGPIQVPVEWVFPALGESMLRYRVYVTHEDSNWIGQLDQILREGAWVYPPYLGMSECLAQVAHVATLEEWTLEHRDTVLPLSTVVPSRLLTGSPELREGDQIVKERTPLALDANRKLSDIGDVLYNRSGSTVNVRLDHPVFEAGYEDGNHRVSEIGVFLQ